MMEKVTRWIGGTAAARISGDTARFLNVLVRSGVPLIDMKPEGETVLLTVRAKHFKTLHTVKLRTHAGVKLVGKSGLPFVLRRVMRRPGLPVGAVLGGILALWLSGFYWGMEIVGEAPVARSALLTEAAACGFYVGAPRSEVDAVQAARKFLEQFPELSWASFNTEGCFVSLNIRAAEQRAEGIEQEGAYDIVASRAGVVRSIAAQSGTVIAKVGSAVEEGEVLVSGITIIGDEYDEERPVRHLLSHARAQVMAETRHTFTASCPLIVESTREIDAGERKNLYLLGLRIPLSLSGAKDCEITAYERKPLTLLGTELPVWTETLRCAELQPVTVEFTEEEARQRAYEKVRLLEENYLGETGILLSEAVSYKLEDGVVYATAQCVLEEDIAREVSMTDGQ